MTYPYKIKGYQWNGRGLLTFDHFFNTLAEATEFAAKCLYDEIKIWEEGVLIDVIKIIKTLETYA